MTDGRSRRQSDHDPVTAGEVARWQARHEAQSDETHRSIYRVLDAQSARIDAADDRADALAIRVSTIVAVASVLWAILLITAPLIRDLIGLPRG
jgi:hypothetical protein